MHHRIYQDYYASDIDFLVALFQTLSNPYLTHIWQSMTSFLYQFPAYKPVPHSQCSSILLSCGNDYKPGNFHQQEVGGHRSHLNGNISGLQYPGVSTVEMHGIGGGVWVGVEQRTVMERWCSLGKMAGNKWTAWQIFSYSDWYISIYIYIYPFEFNTHYMISQDYYVSDIDFLMALFQTLSNLHCSRAIILDISKTSTTYPMDLIYILKLQHSTLP